MFIKNMTCEVAVCDVQLLKKREGNASGSADTVVTLMEDSNLS